MTATASDNHAPIKRILVVGGGTAGWMAAAALNRALGPHATVTLVESDDIGIVGVGEATVPPIRDFNAMIQLDEAEFMRETQATLKVAIEFVDWGRKGSRYFHPFGTYGPGPTLGDFHQGWLALRARGEGGELEDYSLTSQAAKRNRAALQSRDPRSAMSGFFTAYHFDAGLYARYLRKVCEARGVVREEGKIVEVLQRPQDGFVTGVRLEGDRVLEADLFIDCTGFRGLLIEGALKAGYEDWSHWLPMNRAWAVPCERTAPLLPYTRATASTAGWRWRIGLQHRTGNGHVYASDFISDEAARDDLLTNLDGEALAEPRPLRFVTGKRRKLWDKNVVALGLSSGFIEPLESTSIHLVQAGITRLLQHFPNMSFSQTNIDSFNSRLGREIELIRDFVIMHYHLTERDDSEFWKHAAAMLIPDSLSERIEIFRDRGMLFQVGADEYFSQGSWLAVMIGQGVEPRAFNPLQSLGDLPTRAKAMAGLRAQMAQVADSLPDHDAFLAQAGMKAG